MAGDEKQAGFFSLTLYFALICIASGWLSATVALFSIPAPAFKPPYRVGITLGVAVALLTALFFLGSRLRKSMGKPFLYFQLGALVLAAASLGLAETWARSALAPWPARLLHGTAGGAPAETLHSLHPIAVGTNSWGQRDDERETKPAAGAVRIAVLGGSFLEDSSLVPLPLLIEERAGEPFEVVNLGVRGATPRDTYWRARRVALPLGAKRLIVLFDPAEDFLPSQDSRLLPHLARLVIDGPPRASLFGDWFPALTQKLAPIAVPSPSAFDRKFAETLSQNQPSELPKTLASLAPLAKREELATRLAKKDLTKLSQRLASADLGMIQPAFIKRLLVSAVGDTVAPLTQEARDSTAKWLSATAKLARHGGAEMTLVLIPPAEGVDDRLRDVWAAIGDVRRQADRFDESLNWLKEKLADQMDIVDLRPAFKDSRGSYLDADGRWSSLGAEMAAIKVVESLPRTEKTSSGAL